MGLRSDRFKNSLIKEKPQPEREEAFSFLG
jgi:hypothetical protein